MKLVTILFLSFLFVQCCYSQELFQREKRDYYWLLGYDSNPQNLMFGGTLIDFHQEPPFLSYEFRNLNFDITNASICDTAGNLLFYTNGLNVANYLHQEIENGFGLGPTVFSEDWIDNGYPIEQGAIILNKPGSDRLYYIFHSDREWALDDPENSTRTNHCYYSLVDMSEESSLGKVVEKNVVIIADTLNIGKLTAIRHGNGQDWWILVQEFDSNRFYTILLTNEGIDEINILSIGGNPRMGGGGTVFSPKGDYFVRINGEIVGEEIYVDIFDFDRCSGILSNPIQFTYQDGALSLGGAISENGRFFYACSSRFLYQYDLEAEDIEASRVLVSQLEPDELVNFFMAQLAPNGKIYINGVGTQKFLHIIHEPNKLGLACRVERQGVELSTLNSWSLPNFPYFGLGPLDGSSCDTLGIDNPAPEALFSYTIDTATLTVSFFDGTRFAPNSWDWSFGDNLSSAQQYPIHTYQGQGQYEVCLTASNGTGSDSACEMIDLLFTSVETFATDLDLEVFPNPAKEQVIVSFPQGSIDELVLYDMYGREVRRILVKAGAEQQSLSIVFLSTGVYALQGWKTGVLVAGTLVARQG